MAMNLDVVGKESEPVRRSWSSTDAILYALGVGAGQDDPLAELEFTTENTAGVPQRVLPTFAGLLTQFSGGPHPNLGDFDPAMLVHAEQAVTVHRPLPPSGTVEVSSRVVGIYDKGSGALAVTEATGRFDGEDEPTIVTRSSVFVRGQGGFGVRGPSDGWEAPDGKPDLTLTTSSRTDQALLYRLSGDRNPLHSDPAFAARAGFPRPILHGMCTYGIVGRVLLNALCDGRPERFLSISGRFSSPVMPGDALEIAVWTGAPASRFRVSTADGGTVLDRGTFTVRPE